MSANPNEELVPLPEAAERLGISLRTCQEWCAAGKLPVYEISPHRRYVVWSSISASARQQAQAQERIASARRARHEAQLQQRRALRQRQRQLGQQRERPSEDPGSPEERG